MTELANLSLIATAALGGTAIIAVAGLKAFRAWLDVRRLEIEHSGIAMAPPTAAQRIDVADLKERIRKLEAIAAGVDL